MGEHFIMWVKADCPFCITARDELYRRRVDHTIYIMDGNLDELNSMKEKWSHPTVPIVVRRSGALTSTETLIGGYTELKEWFDND
jgi:glutaredoxin